MLIQQIEQVSSFSKWDLERPCFFLEGSRPRFSTRTSDTDDEGTWPIRDFSTADHSMAKLI